MVCTSCTFINQSSLGGKDMLKIIILNWIVVACVILFTVFVKREKFFYVLSVVSVILSIIATVLVARFLDTGSATTSNSSTTENVTLSVNEVAELDPAYEEDNASAEGILYDQTFVTGIEMLPTEVYNQLPIIVSYATTNYENVTEIMCIELAEPNYTFAIVGTDKTFTATYDNVTGALDVTSHN